jgi:hypothetical protein
MDYTEFVYLHYFGETTTPWHVGVMPQRMTGAGFTDYLYTRTDLLWGRGVRGPILRQLWRTYCPKSDERDAVDFKPETDCPVCTQRGECPFNNLRGSNDEGEWKDKPRMIISNLRLHLSEDIRRSPPRLTFNTLDEEWMGVAEERAPYTIEYIPAGIEFDFEIILMAEGARFRDEVDRAVSISLGFLGWGGRCNEGFGRGRIIREKMERMGFSEFWEKKIKPVAESIMDSEEILVEPETILIVDREGGGFYTSPYEEGFSKKLCNLLYERFWQFTGIQRHIDDALERVRGEAKPTVIRGWSRKLGMRIPFIGVSGQLILNMKKRIGFDEAELLSISRYGIGRYKNQGFGWLKIKKGVV